MGVEEGAIIDERQTLKETVIGVNGDVEMVVTMTAEQAEQQLLDLEQVMLESDLTPDEERLRQACISVLTEGRKGEAIDPAESDPDAIRHSYIDMMKASALRRR